MKAPIATPRARALAAALREARQARKIGLRQLADKLGISHAILSFWEKGIRLPKVEDVATIVGSLGIVGDERERLLDLARRAHEPNWLEDSMPGMPQLLTAVAEYERTATTITEWNPSLIPGMLQTTEYTRAIFKAANVPHAQIETRLRIRIARRDVLTRQQPPRYNVLLGETALRQGIGGPEVMAEQLRHLREIMSLPHISLRVVPAGVGYHPGLTGPFSIFDYTDLPSIVLVERHRGSAFLYDEGHIKDYKRATTTILGLAVGEQNSLSLITEREADP
ncbi:helix-turn-helix domain-containing protein [Amycolatopsis anabasis]|uniref:helix-turn-helix domain-containing protein n=1 Tax=Amycolatopsis anabasis TaxID=1840409 RepID=UPI00131AEFD2|nr:helix-turn-helix transcriptional regulator [Amycolatopsis anabasis]